ncbi:helix-hairpin-helix domain-containing protein [Pseudomonas sp. NFXW11]|uniref:ComEA family DNA-binding protein n=1 Tax=Pseudomonas sp. NFXW11 TaxID=2819531 RepID=UPI003CF05D5C
MHTLRFSSLVFALLAGLSLGSHAAPLSQAQADVPVVVQQAPTQAGKINLNSADAAALQRELFGIGEAKAKAIVAYREENGPFASVDELLEVKGIGKTILERNRDKLDLN